MKKEYVGSLLSIILERVYQFKLKNKKKEIVLEFIEKLESFEGLYFWHMPKLCQKYRSFGTPETLPHSRPLYQNSFEICTANRRPSGGFFKLLYRLLRGVG
jgi:hypothetical protein